MTLHLVSDNQHPGTSLHERFEAHDRHWHDVEPRTFALTADEITLFCGACFGAGCLFTTAAAWVLSWYI
jgi:hypothetical protein